MPDRYKLAAVIPAFNPGPVVCSVVSAASKLVDYVIVVDDGSNPENRKYLEESAGEENVRLITFSFNRGKGYALIEGIRAALNQDPDYIITLDSDGQHDPTEIIKFKEAISSNPDNDLIIGVRRELKEMPLRSKIGNIFTAKLFTSLFKEPVVDTQSGYRALSRDFAIQVVSDVMPGRYETEMRMLIYAIESNKKIEEVVIQTLYLENNKNSKFRPFGDSLRVLAAFSKYAGVAAASFALDYSLFLALSYLLGVYYLLSHVIARTCSGTFNFLSNKHLVFKSKSWHVPEAFRYVLAVLFSLSTTALILFTLVEIAGVSRALAKPLAEFTMFLINFVVLNKFVFSKPSPDY